MTESKLELSIALSENENTRAVLDGRSSQTPSSSMPPRAPVRDVLAAAQVRRVRRLGNVDVVADHRDVPGPDEWVALPVFTTREFFHLRMLVRTASGIQAPADFKGKRVGVPEYQQTAAIWSRGVLQHEFGVQPHEIEFFMERTPETSHGGATGFKAPEGVTVNQIPPTTNIGEMMVRGELDATLLYLTHANLVDRSRINLASDTRFKPLFDRAAEAKRYFAKTGIYQINHGMVIRRSIFERHPWAALNIYNAFAKARGDVIRARDTSLLRHFEPG